MADNPNIRQRGWMQMNVGNTRVILVRHGETEANKLQMWHGSLDAPLTERVHI